jgi:glycosyltransferase involved in cell wall biosynthesis
VSSEVCFAGWTPHSDLPGYWAAADIGILPFHTCPHIETTLANKLFDFMAVGLPIVGSDARPMKRVLAETGAGLTFRAGDPGDFARAVSEVLDEPGAAKRMSECGLEASEEIYDWRFDADRLVEAVANPT